jgi:hypothetical protein
MKKIACVVGVFAVLAWGAPAEASEPIGIYGVIDKVVLEPNADAPTRIQIWGTFSLAKQPPGQGVTFVGPTHGYLYYSLDQGDADVCRKEWADLKKVAGTSQIIGFGSRTSLDANGHLRKPTEKPDSPDKYPLGFGLVKMREDAEYSPVRELATTPTFLTPADGDLVPPGKVELSTHNILDKRHVKAAYVFELTNAAGDKEASPQIAAGDKETKWTPKMEVKGGEKCTWSVRAVDGDWKGPAATTNFVAKGQK